MGLSFVTLSVKRSPESLAWWSLDFLRLKRTYCCGLLNWNTTKNLIQKSFSTAYSGVVCSDLSVLPFTFACSHLPL